MSYVIPKLLKKEHMFMILKLSLNKHPGNNLVIPGLYMSGAMTY